MAGHPLVFYQNVLCVRNFTVEHGLSCTRGGFPTLRHNHIRDITASLLSEVSTNVAMEPELQSLSGEVLSPSANKEVGA